MQGFYVVPGGDGWSVVHAATRMPLLDLVSREDRDAPVSGPQASHPIPCPKAKSRPCPRPSHCPLISHRAPGAWWVSPVSDVNCGSGVSGPAHRLRGPSRSGQRSSSWYTLGHRAPLQRTQGWEPGVPKSVPTQLPQMVPFLPRQ